LITEIQWASTAISPNRVVKRDREPFRIGIRDYRGSKTHQSRRPTVSQINNSMLGLAQRVPYKPRIRPDVSTSARTKIQRKESQPAAIPNSQPDKHTHSPKQQSTKHARKKTSITYPTNSPSSAAPSPPHPHPPPSLFPFPSHSYCCRQQKTQASIGGGGGTKRSWSPALKRSYGGMMDSRRKPMRLKTSGGSGGRTAYWGCGLRVWGWRRSSFAFCSALAWYGTGGYCKVGDAVALVYRRIARCTVL
jgi:hypothetical protein